eukprot:73289-Chlamydomonas_euryale.AAC.2
MTSAEEGAPADEYYSESLPLLGVASSKAGYTSHAGGADGETQRSARGAATALAPQPQGDCGAVAKGVGSGVGRGRGGGAIASFAPQRQGDCLTGEIGARAGGWGELCRGAVTRWVQEDALPLMLHRTLTEDSVHEHTQPPWPWAQERLTRAHTTALTMGAGVAYNRLDHGRRSNLHEHTHPPWLNARPPACPPARALCRIRRPRPTPPAWSRWSRALRAASSRRGSTGPTATPIPSRCGGDPHALCARSARGARLERGLLASLDCGCDAPSTAGCLPPHLFSEKWYIAEVGKYRRRCTTTAQSQHGRSWTDLLPATDSLPSSPPPRLAS